MKNEKSICDRSYGRGSNMAGRLMSTKNEVAFRVGTNFQRTFVSAVDSAVDMRGCVVLPALTQ